MTSFDNHMKNTERLKHLFDNAKDKLKKAILNKLIFNNLFSIIYFYRT